MRRRDSHDLVEKKNFPWYAIVEVLFYYRYIYIHKGWRRFVDSINRVFRTLAVGRNAEVGRPQRGAPRRAHVAGGHQTFAGRRQVHTPARVRSGAAGRARARPQKIAQHARACVCSPGARGRGAGAGGRCSACPMRGRAVHMAAGAAPLLRRARRAAVRDGHSRRAWASQTRCGPLGRAAPRRSPGRGP